MAGDRAPSSDAPSAGPEQMLAHVASLRRYARLLTGDASRADDLVQDTLERACRHWARWQPGTHLRAWLATLMHNLFVNQRRDRRHDDACRPLDEILDGADDPAHDPTAQHGQRLDLAQALSALPPAMREVLLLVAVEEHSYAQAAAILGVPIGTVMSRLHRARERMRAGMHPDAPGGRPAASEAAGSDGAAPASPEPTPLTLVARR